MVQPAISASTMTVDPRALAGAAALVMCALLTLLYFYRRRTYILFWCAGWGMTAASMFLAARPYADPRLASVAYGMSQFMGILSGLAFVSSADAYLGRPRLRRQHAVILLPVLLWFTLAPLPLGVWSVFAPGHLLIGGGMIAAGAAHLALLRRVRLLGAGLAGLMLAVIGTAHFHVAYQVAQPASPEAGRVIFLIAGAFLLTGLGMQLMTFEDMTYELRVTNRQLRDAQSNLRELVITDPLTGCRNRRFFDEIIDKELGRHQRYRVPLSLLFIDVNKFKTVNDQLGHEVGDKVLQHVAGFLIRNVREADFVFRWGGDEFLILLSSTEKAASVRAEALQEAFAVTAETAALPAGVGLSVGCAEVPNTARDARPYVKLADERMYANKRHSRSVVVRA